MSDAPDLASVLPSPLFGPDIVTPTDGKTRPDVPCVVCGTLIEQPATGRPRIYCTPRCANQASTARRGTRADGGLDAQLAEAHRLADRLTSLGTALGDWLNTELSPAGVEARITAVQAGAAGQVATAEAALAQARKDAKTATSAAEAAAARAEAATNALLEAEAATTAANENARTQAAAREVAESEASAATARATMVTKDLEAAQRQAERQIGQLELGLQRGAEENLRLNGELEAARTAVTAGASALAVAEDRLRRAQADLAELDRQLTAQQRIRTDVEAARDAANTQVNSLTEKLARLETDLAHTAQQLETETAAREQAARQAAQAGQQAARDLETAVARERESHARETATLKELLAAATAQQAPQPRPDTLENQH